MTTPTIFTHEQFGQIRTETIDGKPYFCAKDIAVALGYTNPQKAVRDHCVRGSDSFTLKYQGQPLKVIPESDLYRLVMKSNLPSAEAFQDWVCEEVLPSIRETGSYSSKPMSQLEILAQSAMALLEQERKLNEVVEVQTLQNARLTEIEQKQELLENRMIPQGWDTHRNLWIKEGSKLFSEGASKSMVQCFPSDTVDQITLIHEGMPQKVTIVQEQEYLDALDHVDRTATRAKTSKGYSATRWEHPMIKGTWNRRS